MLTRLWMSLRSGGFHSHVLQAKSISAKLIQTGLEMAKTVFALALIVPNDTFSFSSHTSQITNPNLDVLNLS